ncbi:MAG: cytochrome c, partial [Nitrospinaceae bacterium]|nr:cytochrome c [Nitrospinaceae bacterium]
MKKALILGVMIVFSLFAVSSAYAAKKKPECPQPRKTKLAPGGISKKDKTGKANLANGKKIY